MKPNRIINYYSIFRYTATVVLAIAFFVHFYFLSLAKNNVSDSTSDRSVLYIQNISSESQIKQLQSIQQSARETNQKAKQVYLELEKTDIVIKGELAPLFAEALEHMAQEDYEQAMNTLYTIEQRLLEI